MLIVCASLSAAPGVSTLATGLAVSWPGQPALLLEADPGGGVLAARFGLAQQPGLTSLAAQMRHGDLAASNLPAQQLPVGCPVVVAPGAADTTCGAVAVLAQHAGKLRELAPVVVADVGRLYVGSPATPLIAAADAVLLALPASTEYLDHVDARIPALREVAAWERLGVVVAGKSSYPMPEIADRLGVPVWGQLPRDRWGAAALTGQMTSRGLGRTRLARAIRDLAEQLTAVVDAPSLQGATR